MNTENLELSAPGILQLFETTKEQRASFVNDIIEKLNDGVVDPLKVHLQVKSLEDIINQLTNTTEKTNKNFKAAIAYKNSLFEAFKRQAEGGKEFEFANAKFSVKEVGTKYDYANCGDLELNELQAKADELAEKIKAKQKYLQMLPLSGMLVTNEESGDTYKVFPPSKSSTTSVAVTLK